MARPKKKTIKSNEGLAVRDIVHIVVSVIVFLATTVVMLFVKSIDDKFQTFETVYMQKFSSLEDDQEQLGFEVDGNRNDMMELVEKVANQEGRFAEFWKRFYITEERFNDHIKEHK